MNYKIQAMIGFSHFYQGTVNIKIVDFGDMRKMLDGNFQSFTIIQMRILIYKLSKLKQCICTDSNLKRGMQGKYIFSEYF